MASGAYRNGVHKGAPAASNFKSSSFKSKHPPVAAPGSGLRRSSSTSLGAASGSLKHDGGGKFRAKRSLLFVALMQKATTHNLEANAKIRKLGSIGLTLRFGPFTGIWFVCYCKRSHRLLGSLFFLAIVHVYADPTVWSRIFFLYFMGS